MPYWYIKFDGGAAKVARMVGLAPVVHGTDTAIGPALMDEFLTAFGGSSSEEAAVAEGCQSCAEFAPTSSFITQLDAGGVTAPGVVYTQIMTTLRRAGRPLHERHGRRSPLHRTSSSRTSVCSTSPTTSHWPRILSPRRMYSTRSTRPRPNRCRVCRWRRSSRGPRRGRRGRFGVGTGPEPHSWSPAAPFSTLVEWNLGEWACGGVAAGRLRTRRRTSPPSSRNSVTRRCGRRAGSTPACRTDSAPPRPRRSG